MSIYIWIAVACAAIPTFAFMLLAPPELQRYTLCVFGIISTFIVAMLGVIAGGSARNDLE